MRTHLKQVSDHGQAPSRAPIAGPPGSSDKSHTQPGCMSVVILSTFSRRKAILTDGADFIFGLFAVFRITKIEHY